MTAKPGRAGGQTRRPDGSLGLIMFSGSTSLGKKGKKSSGCARMYAAAFLRVSSCVSLVGCAGWRMMGSAGRLWRCRHWRQPMA